VKGRSGVIEKFPRELLSISSKYQVISLLLEIEQHLLSTLSIDNALSLLQFSDLFSLSSLRLAAMKIVALNVSILSSRFNLQDTLGQSLFVELMTYMQSNLNPNLTSECVIHNPNPSHFKLVVSGAGISEANGTYIFLGMFSSAGFYSKNCIFRNKPAQFSIYKAIVNPTDPNFVICWVLMVSVFGSEMVIDPTFGCVVLYVLNTNDLNFNVESTIPLSDVAWHVHIGNESLGGDPLGIPKIKCIRDV
jgi:hypothetical protein